MLEKCEQVTHAVMCSQMPPSATVSGSAVRTFLTAYELVAVAPCALALTIHEVSGPSRAPSSTLDHAALALPGAHRTVLALRVAENAGRYLEGAGRLRDNGRPVLLASTLAPSMLSLYPRQRPMVACPDCGRWRTLHRGMLAPHRAEDGVSRCPGSAWRVRIDLSPGEWLARLEAACRSVRRPVSLQRATGQVFRRARSGQLPQGRRVIVGRS